MSVPQQLQLQAWTASAGWYSPLGLFGTCTADQTIPKLDPGAGLASLYNPSNGNTDIYGISSSWTVSGNVYDGYLVNLGYMNSSGSWTKGYLIDSH